MKSIIVAAIIAVACPWFAFSNASVEPEAVAGIRNEDPLYTKTMESTIQEIATCKTPSDYLKVINQFERVSSMNPKDWLSVYWAGYSYTLASFAYSEAATKDQFLEKAEQLAKKLNELKPNDDEVAVLEAFIAQSRMSVDPQNRFTTYGTKFNELIAKARKINPENPRIYNLQGRSLFYTPENFGGGKASACPIINLAIDKYNKFVPSSSIHPSWGRDYTETLLNECNKK